MSEEVWECTTPCPRHCRLAVKGSGVFETQYSRQCCLFPGMERDAGWLQVGPVAPEKPRYRPWLVDAVAPKVEDPYIGYCGVCGKPTMTRKGERMDCDCHEQYVLKCAACPCHCQLVVEKGMPGAGKFNKNVCVLGLGLIALFEVAEASEEPDSEKPRYRPWTAEEAIGKVVRVKGSNEFYLITGADSLTFHWGRGHSTPQYLLDNYEHVDGRPCGVEVE